MSGSVKITLQILLLLCFYTVFSQTGDTLISKIQTGKISGVVIDSKNSTPLINSECKLYKSKDTIVLRISKTDSTGHLSIDSITYGKYWIEIDQPGYTLFINNKITLDENHSQFRLDTIKLNKSDIETEEIQVEGEKPLFTFEGDKKIFNVTESISNMGGTVLDVLKKVPMVNVDINDNVTLRGAPPKILIDNKENRYMDLKQLPAEGVEKIELITNPPAKYASEGITGIINIVMKKSNKLGFNGYSSMFAGTQDKYGCSLNINFKKKKTVVFTGIYPGYYRYSSASEGSTQYYIPAVSYLNNNGNYTSKYASYYLNAGIEYDIMKNSVIGIESNGNLSSMNNSPYYIMKYLDANEKLTSYYENKSNSDGKWNSFNISAYMDLKFNEKGKELSSDISYSQNRNNFNTFTQRQYYDSLSFPVNNTPLNQKDTNNTFTRNMSAQLDYTYPFGTSNEIETGYRGLYRVNDNDALSDTMDYNRGIFVNNVNFTNHFKLTEIINSVYLMFSSKIKGFRYKFGLRVENTNAKGELLTDYISNTRNYTDFFPTVNLSQTVGQSNQIQLSYSRRITRPGWYRLNPFENKNSPGIIFIGNPDLNPEFTDSYELSYMLFTKGFTLTPSAFFRRQHDVISTYSYQTDTGTTIITYKNANGADSYGLDFIVSSRTPEWLNLNATFSFYNTRFDRDYVTDYSGEEGFTWRANIRTFISFSKIFKADLFYNYIGKRVNAQSISRPSQNLDAGFSVNLFKEKATIRLSVSDIFKTSQWASNTNGIGYSSSYKNQYDSRMLWVNISYRFGNSDEYYQKKKKTKQNENESNDTGDEEQKK